MLVVKPGVIPKLFVPTTSLCQKVRDDLSFAVGMLLHAMYYPWMALFFSLVHFVAARVAWDGASLAEAGQIGPYSTERNLRSSPAAEDSSTYTSRTVTAINALQTWYDPDEGLWDTTGWWNSANCLTVLADFYTLDESEANSLGLSAVFSSTFTQAQQTTFKTRKTPRARSEEPRIIKPRNPDAATHPSRDGRIDNRGFSGFINDYYDDEGWWALAWIRAYDATGEQAYLAMAESIFHDMQGGMDDTCGGGIWWSKARSYKNAIANELFLAVAASLARRVSDSADRDAYLQTAEAQWKWFLASGMINGDGVINDGLTIYSNGTCVNNGQTVWSYNQGVVLGGLVELYKAGGNSTFLSEAAVIADAAISALSVDGILHDECEDDSCGGDGSQFKGKSVPFQTLPAPRE